MESGGLKTLVTGAAGFLGAHLCTRLMNSASDELIPVARNETNRFYGCGLCDKDEVLDLLRITRPARIFHCAGSFSNEFEQDFNNNVLTTLHLLQAIEELDLSCRILLIGSAAEYGIPETETGFIDEGHPLKPVSMYGLSKVCQTQLMEYFWRTQDVDIVMARIFTLDGDGVNPLLFAGRVRTQINDYLSRKADKIEVGDLSAYRDYLPVEEAVSDLIAIMKYGEAGEVYNIGSGNPIQMKEFLNRLLHRHNIPADAINVDYSLETKSSRVSVVAADLSKIQLLKANMRVG